MFWIQASNPRFSREGSEEDSELPEALESAFVFGTEAAIMFWNRIPIALDYKYDLSYLAQDALLLVQSLNAEAKGSLQVAWPSNTFRTDWAVEWDERQVRVAAEWTQVVGVPKELLNASGPVTLSRVQFQREWRKVFGILLEGLTAAGYSETDVPDIGLLKRVTGAIDQDGRLYAPPLDL